MQEHEDPALSASRPNASRSNMRLWPASGLWVALMIAPLVVALTWGTYFDDSTFAIFQKARDLAAGRELIDHPVRGLALPQTHASQDRDVGGQALAGSPLHIVALGLVARLGIPLPQAALVLSALGWGATAVAVYSACQAMRRPVAAAISGTLITFSPAIVSTLGSELPWTTAFAWIAIVSSMKKKWHLQTGALALLLWTHLGLSTLTLMALLWAVQWVERRRFPLWSSVFLAAATLGLGLIVSYQFVAPLSLSHPVPGEWARSIRQLSAESEFYWLFPPLAGLGLAVATRKALWAGLLWATVSILTDSAVAGTMMISLGLFLAGLGIDRVIQWIETHNVVRLDRAPLAVSLALVAGLPLGIAQASSLVRRYSSRPAVRQELEQQAGDWLRAHSEPTATILGPERVGYVADRATFPWNGESDPMEVASLLKALNENPPGYCVSFTSIAWYHLTQTEWFQESYESLHTIESPYDATSPFTIWRYRFGSFDLGPLRPLNVHLPGQVDLVGYRYWPDRIEPGEAVYVTLYFRAMQPFPGAFTTIARITSPHDGVSQAQRDTVTSRDALVGWWQTGQGIAERLVLTTTTGIPVGAYHLEMSVTGFDSSSVLPMYRDDDTSPLDRVVLGDVVVPWQGTLEDAERVDANFGDEVNLLGFKAVDKLAPGAEWDVTLYWEARRPPESDYIVFIHLLDAEGRVAGTHDGPPMDGRYAATAWRPGEVVPDVHRIVLDPQTAAGIYRLRVGIYQWPSLERVPVWDSQGAEQADRVITLQSVEVR